MLSLDLSRTHPYTGDVSIIVYQVPLQGSEIQLKHMVVD